MKPSDLQDIADVCKMLADPNRVSIVAILAIGTKTVGTLCDALELPQPTVSYHLSLLRLVRLIDQKRKGKEMHYSLDRERLGVVRKFLAGLK